MTYKIHWSISLFCEVKASLWKLEMIIIIIIIIII